MNEQDILKYLDNELPKGERAAFEEKLERDPDLKRKVQAFSAKRKDTLDAIGSLDPAGPVNIPNFKTLQNPNKKGNLLIHQWWKVAAAVLILVAVSIVLFNQPDPKPENIITAENTSIQKTDEPELCSQLDYYISPNRCWNKRELVWRIVELENGD